MACSLTKLKLIAAASFNPLKAATRSAVLFRPVAASSTRLFNTKISIQSDCSTRECNFNLKNDGSYTTNVPDVFNSYLIYQTPREYDSSNVICPRLSATRNLVRLLYLMDDRIEHIPGARPIWDVMEDAESLYLVRDLSGGSHQDVKEFATDSPTGIIKLYGTSLRVSCETPIPQAIEFTVGRRRGYHPGAFYPGYMIKIDLPPTLYRASGIWMELEDQFFKISIPKKEGKWIENINLQLKLFSTINDPIFYWSAPLKTKS